MRCAVVQCKSRLLARPHPEVSQHHDEARDGFSCADGFGVLRVGGRKLLCGVGWGGVVWRGAGRKCDVVEWWGGGMVGWWGCGVGRVEVGSG